MRALVLTCLLLAGCGQAGDLYLPPKEPAQPESAAPPTAPQPAPPATDQKDKK